MAKPAFGRKAPPPMQDFGDPDGPPAQNTPPPGAGGPGDNDADDTGQGVVLTLDQIGYHDEPHSCQLCKHYHDGMCEVAQQTVSPEGGCDVFAAQDEDSGGMGQPQQGMPPQGMRGGGQQMMGGGAGPYGS